MPLLVGAAQAAAPNTGASTLQEVVVTAQKREQRLQDVPISVTALSQTQLVANRIENVNDLNGLAPNLTTRPSAGSTQIANYTLRGLFATGSAPGADKGVSEYIDGVYLQNPSSSIFNLADIQRIEVLKGPQGTLFGRNATGGAVSVFTRNPTGRFGFKQDFTGGNYDEFKSRTRLDLPAFGPLSATLMYTHEQRRGDVRNLGAGRVWDYSKAAPGVEGLEVSPSWLGGENINAFFAAIRFAPSAKFNAVLKWDWSHDDYTPDANGIALVRPGALAGIVALTNTPISTTRPDAVNNWFSTPGHATNSGTNLTMDYDATDHIKLRDIVAYRYARTQANNQLDGLGGIQLAPGLPFLGIVNSTLEHDNQFSNEMQFNYNASWVTFTAGWLHFDSHQSEGGPPGAANTIIFSPFPIPNAAPPVFNFVIPLARIFGDGVTQSALSVVHLRSEAIYAQPEIHLTKQLDVVFGIRETWDHKRGTDTGAPGSPIPIIYDKSKASFLGGINYKPTDDILTYIKYSTGYVSGGFLANFAYKAETAKSWEAGIKSDWFEHRLRANLAIYTVRYGDLQQVTSGSTFHLIVPSVPQTAPQVTFNLGNARATGFEFETSAKPTEHITLDGGVGYTHFKVLELQPFLGTLTPGQPTTWYPPYRPEWTANLSGEYDTGEIVDGAHASFRLDANFQSQSHTCSCGSILATVSDPFGVIRDTTIPDQWTLNGRIALTDFRTKYGMRGTVAIWGKNLTDNKNEVFTAYLGPFTGANYQWARTFGVDLTFEY
jgi:iron complex outermembrane receptor protein